MMFLSLGVHHRRILGGGAGSSAAGVRAAEHARHGLSHLAAARTHFAAAPDPGPTFLMTTLELVRLYQDIATFLATGDGGGRASALEHALRCLVDARLADGAAAASAPEGAAALTAAAPTAVVAAAAAAAGPGRSDAREQVTSGTALAAQVAAQLEQVAAEVPVVLRALLKCVAGSLMGGSTKGGGSGGSGAAVATAPALSVEAAATSNSGWSRFSK
ncbi:unnamed protein product [Phaeothamnion confervicola]